MSRQPLSRRTILGAGAAATAATVTLAGVTNVDAASAAPTDGSPRPPEPETPGGLRTEALVDLADGEEVIFYTPAALVPNTTSTLATAGSIYEATIRGVRPSGASAVLSASVNVPRGSVITRIEFVISGTPQAGSVRFNRYTAELVNDAHTVYVASPSGTGITVYASPLLSELYTGAETFEAYYASADTTSWCKGIRVIYRPPAAGLVAINPVRVYDSRLTMTPDANGVLAGGAFRTVTVSGARDVNTGALSGVTVVPKGATAVAYTLTATNTTSAGYLAVNPGGVTTVAASTINWSTNNDSVANTGVVKLGPNRTVTVVQGGGGQAHFAIDIVGYY